MVVTRKISRNKYLFAFLITLIVFSLGLLLGLVIENKRVKYIELQDETQKQDINSLQLQYQIIDAFGEEKNCEAIQKTFEINAQNLENLRDKLEKYQANANLNKKDFDLLKREYTLAQIKFWLITKKTKSMCNIDAATIFYFYADAKNCTKCQDQAVVLTYLKDKFGSNLLTFVFDSQLKDEPIIDLLKKVYGIQTYPTLIINEKKYDGFTTKEIILKDICPKMKNTTIDLCNQYQTVIIS